MLQLERVRDFDNVRERPQMFQRFEDEEFAEDSEYRSAEHMAAEEALVGLRLLHVGSIKVTT